MPQPAPYAPSFDFTGYQAANPAAPLPGPRVDAELDGLQETIAGILANLALIQRDDGKLANGAISPDSLGTALIQSIASAIAGKTATVVAISALGFGAKGDGETNDEAGLLAALQYAAPLGLWVDGAGLTFAVADVFEVGPITRLRNCTIKQTDAGTNESARALYQSGGTIFHLDHVKIDRGTNGASGSLNDSGGIWVDTCPDVRISECEVFGSCMGSGIAAVDCGQVHLYHPFIHDLIAGTPTGVALIDDAIDGISLTRCDQFVITCPRIHNLQTQWAGQALWNRYTRGIALQGCKGGSIVAPMVDGVDQGNDITGDENNTRISIFGGEFRNCYTWGCKAANTATRISYHGVKTWRCGLSGFVVSPPAAGTTPVTGSISYHGCYAIETGYQNNGLGTTSGFRILNNVDFPTQPQGIRYFGCGAHADGAAMQYGFLNDCPPPAASPFNSTHDCEASGATIALFSGFKSSSSLLAHCTATTTTGNGVTLIFDTVDHDDLGEYDPATGVWTSKVDGKVVVCARWTASGIPNASAAGLMVRKNGAALARDSVTNITTGSLDVVVEVAIGIAVVVGDTIDIRSFTNGTNFNVNTGHEFTNLSIEQVA